MKFKALSTFVIFNGQMNVFNDGAEGDLPAEMVQPYIDNGKAVSLEGVDEDETLADDAAAIADMTVATEPEAAADAAPAAEPEAPPPAAPTAPVKSKK